MGGSVPKNKVLSSRADAGTKRLKRGDAGTKRLKRGDAGTKRLKPCEIGCVAVFPWRPERLALPGGGWGVGVRFVTMEKPDYTAKQNTKQREND
jgi:hypothetical protein